ncbi:MAG: GNAT family N-acetyltransferase [Clostridia bacterium]|nr:GNAT family N-acetyltransferase [Clostridia bacterium]
MLYIDKASPGDIPYISSISAEAFSSGASLKPIGSNDPGWYADAASGGYLFKITFDGVLVGGLVVFKTGNSTFQLERIFILPSYQGLGIGRKSLDFIFKRFPEAKVWYVDAIPGLDGFSHFLKSTGFFESGFVSGSSPRYIKLPK